MAQSLHYGDCICAPLPKPEELENAAPADRYHAEIVRLPTLHVNDLCQKLPRQRLSSAPTMAFTPDGAHRTAKGLRHAYGVNAISRKIPLNMLQKWMGHADPKITAIYANAIGEEEANIAAQMWE